MTTLSKPFQVAALTLFVLLVGGLVACGGSSIPEDVEWEVKQHESFDVLHFRRVILRVSINRAVNEEILMSISDKLRTDAVVDAAMRLGATSRDHEITIFYYLSGMNVNTGGAWGIAEYNDPHSEREDSIVIPGNTTN